MTASLRLVHSLVRSTLTTIRGDARKFKGAFAALLFVLPLLCTPASAQTTTTTISGTVYDPRGSANNGLPLPGVLVYATTGTPAALNPGVQCLTAASSVPSDPNMVSYTNTAVDGTFTLTNVPENATYTVVIQAGKWRRQFPNEAVAAAPLTGIELDMPADHTQGDIPLIAIATGSIDALECVFHDMGIANTEFTDDNGTVNLGGRIHLYKGSGSPGAEINPSTPSQNALVNNSATLNGYDMVMFPCQGGPYYQSATALGNLLDYANAGGRVFATHYSYVWLNPNPPDDSQFPPVADWVGDSGASDGKATINTNFNDGATLAQWLLNSGASSIFGQVPLTQVKIDLSGVIAPTQSWATLNTTNTITQMTFNTPVGAAAASQCGRVLFNDYHVYEGPGASTVYPAACTGTGTMTAQEKMLEYALFDLSSFVSPVVVPTLTISFTPSPLIVDQGDIGDQLTVNVTNTSTTTTINGSAILTITPPQGLTITAMTDSTGGWNCTVSTLTCTRTAGLAPSTSDPVTLAISVPAYPAGGLSSYQAPLTATVSSPTFSNNPSATDTVIFQQIPVINWTTPASIIFGTALSGVQLDATSPLTGSFIYSPPAGTVLTPGAQTLKVTFTPADNVDYTTATATVILIVKPATPVLTLTTSTNPAFLQNPVTFTATFAASTIPPTGTVTFYEGSTPLGSGTVSAGVATYTTTALTVGTQSITAVYSGDSNYASAPTNALTELVQDFTIALASGASGTQTAPFGGQAIYSLVVTPIGAATLPAAVSLSVTGLPQGMTSAFSVAPVAAGAGVTPVLLGVLSPSNAASRPQHRPFGGSSLPVALGLILLPFAGRLRKSAYRWQRHFVLALAGAALAVGLTAGLSGCGGVTLTPQTSTLTVTAASGPLSHTLTLTLIVK